MSEIKVYRYSHGPGHGVDIFFLFSDDLWIQLPVHGRTLSVHSLAYPYSRTYLEESITLSGVPSSFLELLIMTGLTKTEVEEAFSPLAITGVMKWIIR